jgi:hypothetical protein
MWMNTYEVEQLIIPARIDDNTFRGRSYDKTMAIPTLHFDTFWIVVDVLRVNHKPVARVTHRIRLIGTKDCFSAYRLNPYQQTSSEYWTCREDQHELHRHQL